MPNCNPRTPQHYPRNHLIENGNSPTTPSVDALRKLQEIRTFRGEPSRFWSLYLETLLEIVQAPAGVVCLLDPQNEWLTLAHAPQGPNSQSYLRLFLEEIEQARLSCKAQNFAIFPKGQNLIIGCPLVIDSQGTMCLFLACLERNREPQAYPLVQSLLTSNDLYAHYRIHRSVGDSLLQKQQLAQILDLSVLINTDDRFLACAMTLVNELSTRHKCQRVSIGWMEHGYAKIKAISHTSHFEKKMDVVRTLEDAMEESFEQDGDLVWPTVSTTRTVVRAQETYAKSQDSGHLATLLLRLGEEAVAVVCLERKNAGFDEQELQMLRISLDQVARRLHDLHDRDRWFGARWADKIRRKLSKWLGFEHTWIKAGILAAMALAAFVALVPIPYRVDAPALLRTDRIVYVTAPFEGYIDSVSVKPGDLISKGQELFRLDRKDLLLQEADLVAESQNYLREIQKAQAAEDLASIRINTAKLEQTTAKLSTTRWRLEQSVLRSEFGKAVVVEGNLEQKRGAPVRQGEELLKIARIENIYAEIDVEESELRNILQSKSGEIALKSRPSETFKVKIERINPAAVVKDKDNVFLVRATLDKVPDWFRPGMAGVAKLDAGTQTLWWIISHRTIDFLRLKLWW